MAITRIKNNQVTDASAGNVYLGINAAAKLQDYSITAGKIANSLVYGSDFTVTGNLTVNGQTTTIDTVSVVIEDPILYLAANQTGSPSLDIGFIGERGTSQNIALVWDESAGEFVTVYTNDTTTNSTVTISSYADFHTNNANIGGNIVINGTTSLVGNIISNLNITANLAAGNISTPGLISAVGNISGQNLNAVANVETANLRVTSMTANRVVFTGEDDYLITTQNFEYDGSTANIQGILIVDNYTINGTDIVSNANITITSSSAGNANIDVTPAGNGVVNIGNIAIHNNEIYSSVGNITLDPAANIVLPDETASAVLYLTVNKEVETSSNFVYDGTTANIQGELIVDNININGNDISTTNANGNLTITPNGTGWLVVDAEDSNFLGNLTTSGDLISNSAVTATGNVSGGNLNTAGQVVATGNITGGNLNAVSAITAGTTIDATGNITGGNLTTAGVTDTGSLVASTTIDATGNITGGNLITAGLTSTGTLETAGNALIGGNLIVQGNITYINIDDLRVEDPIIILGTGPNGAPLSADDGLDRGVYMEYYTTGLGNAYVGWKNSSGNMVIANDVYFTGNDVVGINSYGTLEVGNIYGESAVFVGNVNAGNLISDGAVIGNVEITGNLELGNLSVSGVINTTGNITGGNLVSNAAISAATTINATGNITGGNLITAGVTDTGSLTASTTIDATGNITGGNLITAGLTSTATLNASGNANVGNLGTAGLIVATGNITGGNLVTAGVTDTGSLVASTTIDATGNITGGNLITAGLTSTATLNASGNANVGNLGTAGLIVATGNIDGGNLNTGAQVVAVGNITGGNLNTGGQVVATGNITGANVIGTTSGQFGNIVISGDDITDTNGRVNINTAGADVDFAVNGDTTANIFYVDAGTGTASFGSATQTTGAGVAFNYSDAILLPTGNSAQRPTGVTGMVRFNTTLDSLEFYDADSWVSAGTVFTVIDSQVFNGDGSTVAFTLDSDQTTDSCIVSINGVVQIPVVAYAVSGNVMTFTEAPLSQDVIEVRKITTTVTVRGISNSVGNAVVEVTDTSNDVAITGDLIPVANNTQSLGTATNRWNDVFVSGGSITLGNIVLKNETGNTLAFYGPDGTTPGVLSSNNVDTTSIANGNASVQTFSASGNVGISAGGNANVLVVDGEGIHVYGNIVATGNIVAPQILTVTSPLLYLVDDAPYPYNYDIGFFSNFTGGPGNIYQHTGVVRDYVDNEWKFFSNVAEPSGNVVTFDANTTYDTVAMGQLRVNLMGNATAIVNGSSNGVGNIGSSSTYFNTVFAKATSAQYADLAENYESDANYEPGTVVCFGGAKEVTVCNTENCTRVAGVVSTNPSYLMNSGQTGAHVVAVALQGRVPTKVTGQIRKGDLIVSAGDGRGRANNDARAGTIIGKALADFDGQDGVIEVVVGRV